MTTYISDTAHYKEVLTRIPQVKHSLWFDTADIKDLYMDLPAGQLGVRGCQKKSSFLNSKTVYCMSENDINYIGAMHSEGEKIFAAEVWGHRKSNNFHFS